MYDDEVEMKSGSAIQSAPAAYDGGVEYRQGQKLEVCAI